MTGMIKNHRFYLKFLLIIFLFTFLSGCGGVTITDPIIISFSADMTTITEGDSVTLSWEVTEATAVTIDPGIGLVDLTGFISVFPAATTTYLHPHCHQQLRTAFISFYENRYGNHYGEPGYP